MTQDIQLNAFPLYLKHTASAWYLTLSDDYKTTSAALKKAFKERFISGPNNWLLSQQLGTRKQLLTS